MSTVHEDRSATDWRLRCEALSSFNRHVAHDLRDPLGQVAGFARIAQDSLARGDYAATSRQLECVADGAERLAHLLADLLALAEASEGPLSVAPVDLNELVDSAIEQVQHERRGAPASIRRAPLPVVRAHAGLLRQVYVNLLSNALKFTRAAPRPSIEIGAELQADRPLLFVKDNGVGFDASRAARLFQPFSRLHGTDYPGHGIGLSLVQRVVERHGGRVWARPQQPCGAWFGFTLG